MLNFRPILLVIGTLLCILSIAMVIPALVDIYFDGNNWSNFLVSSFITGFFAITLVLTNHGKSSKLSIRETFLLTVGSWVSLALFSSIPFAFSNTNISYIDALFEATSGITTTGATAFIGLDYMPKGILVWRSLLQWLGGMGIIITAIVVLPMLNIGGMQLFRTDSSDKSENIVPRIAQISIAMSSVYFLLTVICALLLIMSGMEEFDAINHAMTTISTGGFSTHDTSIFYFNNIKIEIVIVIFMIMGAMPFKFYVQILKGQTRDIVNSEQVRFFIAILCLFILVVTIWLDYNTQYNFKEALRLAFFNVTSILTTTGFLSSDFSPWGSFAIVLLFLLSAIGGCSSSTTGGIKIFRLQILYEMIRINTVNMIQPHGIVKPKFRGKVVSDEIITGVINYVIIFAASFMAVATVLAFFGVDFVSALSISAASISNTGVGLGDLAGPAGSFSTFSDPVKYVMIFAMLLGRVEIFTFFVLLTPNFWRD